MQRLTVIDNGFNGRYHRRAVQALQKSVFFYNLRFIFFLHSIVILQYVKFKLKFFLTVPGKQQFHLFHDITVNAFFNFEQGIIIFIKASNCENCTNFYSVRVGMLVNSHD